MTAIRHTTNAGRARARLLSTPTGRDDMSTTIAGVKFSDQLAALLDHAIANGFRVEPDTRPKGARGNVVIYAPDKDVSPITISEKGAKYNRAHYENIRRELYRAGLPPLPADLANGTHGVVIAGTKEEALAQAPAGSAVLELGSDDVGALLSDPESGPGFLDNLLTTLAKAGGLGSAEADLVGTVSAITYAWAQKYSPDRIAEGVATIGAAREADLRSQIDETLAMAAEAEKRVEAAERAVAKADEREKKAREDCAAALRRAEAAEARARELEAAIAPLRNLLTLPNA